MDGRARKQRIIATDDDAMSHPGGHWTVMRSMRRDPALSKRALRAGTARRVLGVRAAVPVRRCCCSWPSIVLDALIGVATPVLAGRVVNQITGHGTVHAVAGSRWPSPAWR